MEEIGWAHEGLKAVKLACNMLGVHPLAPYCAVGTLAFQDPKDHQVNLHTYMHIRLDPHSIPPFH